MREGTAVKYRAGGHIMFDSFTLAGITVTLIITLVVVGLAYKLCPFCGKGR